MLLGVLAGDAATGRLLAAQRDRTGRLTPLDLAAAGVTLPPGAGYASDHFVVTTTVTQGATTVTLISLVERRGGARPDVVVISRRLAPG